MVGAVVPLMASKEGGLGDEVGWLVGWLVGDVSKRLRPLMARWVVSNILAFSNLFDLKNCLIWIGLELLVFQVGWFA